MTCIVAVTDGTTSVLAADSQTTYGWTRLPGVESKVIRKERLLIGVTGAVRVANVVAHFWTPPKWHTDVEAFDWMVKEAVPSLRTILEEHDCVRTNEGIATVGPKDGESAMLAIVGGVIFRVGSDFSVHRSAMPYNAFGSGADYALGVLHHLHATGAPIPRDAAKAALDAAVAFDLGCQRPYTYVREEEDEHTFGPDALE